MTQARSLTANFSLKSYTLSLQSGNGGIVVGAGTFDHGQQATIQATPQTGYQFDKWTEAGVSININPSTTILMDGDKNWTAIFTIQPPNTYSLTLSSSPNSAGTTSGAGSYATNDLTSISATPNTGYQFINWSGAGITDLNSNSTTVSMVQDRNLTANFALNTYALSITAGTGGSISGSGTFNHGTNPTISATPNTGYQFTSWSGAGITDLHSNSTTVSMIQDRNLTANFSLNSYTLSINAGTGGSISGPGTYNHGTNPIISASPNTGYHFIGWNGTGINDLNSSSTTVSMVQNRNLTANFSLNSYILSINAGTGGSISGSGTYNHGTNPTISATPNTGYQFTTWTGEGVANQNSNPTTVSMVKDQNLTALFSLRTINLTLQSSEGGSVSGGGIFNFGSTVDYSATAENGYTFKKWTLDDQNFSDASSGSLQITSDLILSAHFEKSLDPALSSAQSLGNNIFSSWLGYFLTFDNGWYYHIKLGWIYPQGDSSDGLWFWSSDAGWFWTNEEIFKESFLWSNLDNDWVFIKEGTTANDTLLYSYKDGGGWKYLPGTQESE